MDARKIRFDEAAVEQMKKNASEVVIARGESKLGPSGNLKAPTIRFGKTILVGWKEDIWRKALD